MTKAFAGFVFRGGRRLRQQTPRRRGVSLRGVYPAKTKAVTRRARKAGEAILVLPEFFGSTNSFVSREIRSSVGVQVLFKYYIKLEKRELITRTWAGRWSAGNFCDQRREGNSCSARPELGKSCPFPRPWLHRCALRILALTETFGIVSVDRLDLNKLSCNAPRGPAAAIRQL